MKHERGLPIVPRDTDAAPAEESARDRNLSALAYDRLYAMILHRQLPGGTVVVEGRLADELQISRTPMREALGRLAGEGLLQRSGTRSYVVRKVDATEFFQSMKVRELLEGEAITLAEGRIDSAVIESLRADIARMMVAQEQESRHWALDDRLHMLFADHSGNAVLAKLIRQVRINSRLFEVSSPFRRVKADGEEHLAVLDAFAAGNAREARRLMLRHLRNLQEEAMAILSGRNPASR